MFIIPLLLTMGLDLSLPEFQPDTDISGNYVVGSYDVSSDEMTVELMSDNPVSGNDSAVTDSLSIVPADVSISSVSDNNEVVSAIEQLNADNNGYWELFLDSYPVSVSHSLRSSFVTALPWKFTSSGGFTTAGGSHDCYAYMPVVSGIEYHISNITSPTFNSYRYGVINDLNNPTVVTNFGTGNITELTFISGQSGYLVFYINYDKEVGFLADWTTIERESYTLSELGNAVVTMREEFNIKLRAVLFVCLMSFLYPIAMAIKKNILGGEK